MALQKVLKAASAPVSRQIHDLLKTKSRSAGEIASHFDITDAAVSQHLSILKDAGLVTSRREGKQLIYELNASVLEEMLIWIQSLQGDGEETIDENSRN